MFSAKLEPQYLLDLLAAAGLTSCLGVPDSTLDPLISCLDGDSRFENIRATNECEAVAIAMGQFLATNQPSVVYLQNSGFGKTIHPITSLLSPEVCSIPVLLIIGWRGEPGGAKDEPQHVTMGRVMPLLLQAIDVPFEVLTETNVAEAIAHAQEHLRDRRSPFALIVRPGLLAAQKAAPPLAGALHRQEVIQALLDHLPKDCMFVSTTGKTSRELYALREARGEGHANDFYTVGGMGCASSIGLGLAKKLERTEPKRHVCVIDGDGAALMQLGSLATLGHQRPSNLLHVLIDNESYESTGGQPSISPTVDFAAVALGCGYPWVRQVSHREDMEEALSEAKKLETLGLLIVKAARGSDPKLGRPTQSPGENVRAFLSNLGKEA